MQPSVDILDQIPLIGDSSEDVEVTGQLSSSIAQTSKSADTFGTLDEPVWMTVKRDLGAVCSKFRHVLQPQQSHALLREWDLWGPLFLCVLTAILLHDGSGDRGPQFTEIFIITWFGSCIVTLNIKLLGGNVSFFQSLCVLGYCMSPTVLALILCKLILFFKSQHTTVFFLLRLVLTVFGFSWSTYASTAFLSGYYPPKRKFLAVFPIFLFYFVISWLIISQTHYGH